MPMFGAPPGGGNGKFGGGIPGIIPFGGGNGMPPACPGGGKGGGGKGMPPGIMFGGGNGMFGGGPPPVSISILVP
jgi:hypothetical protein